MQSKEHGVTVKGVAGPFVTAHLAAKLSGVNLGTTLKVLAALDAIRATHKALPGSLLDYWRAPLGYVDAAGSAQIEEAYGHVIDNADKVSPAAWAMLKPGRNHPSRVRSDASHIAA